METTALTEAVLERRGCPLHYWTGGPEDRPLVVFTHGACVDHHSFDPQVPIVGERYRVLNWDVRGHGLSQPMAEPFSLPLAVEDLLAIVDTLGVEKATFVGHSNGTYIAQELAFRHPERVQALVIADGTCITWKHTALDHWILRASGDLMALFPYETLKKAGLSQISANKSVQEYTYRAYSQISKQDFITIWKGLTRGLHYEPGYRITQPLLLTHGADDATGDIRKIAPLWAAQTPNCQYEVIPDARHFVPLDQPELFTRLIMEFLEKWAG
jgi:pimeloyl-ACP methyl ester carboxylesterase